MAAGGAETPRLSPFANMEPVEQGDAIAEADAREEAELEQPHEVRNELWARFLHRRNFQVTRERDADRLEKQLHEKQQHQAWLHALEQVQSRSAPTA